MKASVPGDHSLINIWVPWLITISFWAAVPGMWLARPILFPDVGLYFFLLLVGGAILFALYHTWNLRKWLIRSWECIRHGPAEVKVLREGLRFIRPSGESQHYDWSDVVEMRANWFDLDELPHPVNRSLELVLESGHEVLIHSGGDWREAQRILSMSDGILRDKPVFLYDRKMTKGGEA